MKSFESLEQHQPEAFANERSISSLLKLVRIAPYYEGEIHGHRTGSFNYNIPSLHSGFLAYSNLNLDAPINVSGYSANLDLAEYKDGNSNDCVITKYNIREGKTLSINKKSTLSTFKDSRESIFGALVEEGIDMSTELFDQITLNPSFPTPDDGLLELENLEKAHGLGVVGEDEVQKLIRLMKLGMKNYETRLVTKDKGLFIGYVLRRKLSRVLGEVTLGSVADL